MRFIHLIATGLLLISAVSFSGLSSAASFSEPSGARVLSCQQSQGDYPAPAVEVKVLFVSGAIKRVLSRDPYGFQYFFSPRYDGDDTVVMQASKGGHWGIFYCAGAMQP